MIHFLQCLWWEWRWWRLRAERLRIRDVIPLAWLCDPAEYNRLTLKALRVERDMAALERKMRVRP